MFKKTKVCSGVLVALGGALLVSAMPSLAQSGDRVEITGSRIKTIATEGASPITVLGAADIKVDGVRNVESLLNNLPQVFSDQGGNVVNGSTGTAQVNLRGLGSDRTLVLMNGRRLPMGSPTQAGLAPDLNQIPAGLIKRIEVLTGGASAVYGSDAISGVVNFIMNDKFEGVQADLNYSFFNHRQQNTAGVADVVAGRAVTNPAQFAVPGNKSSDGAETNFSLLMGGNFDAGKGNATVFFNYKKTDALLQSERDFSACSLDTTVPRIACGGSSTNATGRINNRTNNTNWTNADSNGTARAFNGALDQYNFGPLNYFQRPSERYGFNAFANYQVSDVAKVYGEFSMHDDLTVAQIAPGGVFYGGGVYTAKEDNPLLSQSWKNALGLTTPGSSTNFFLGRRNVEGGGRQSEYRNTSFRSLIGVKGDVGNWSYDAYAIRAKVVYSQTDENYFLDDRIAKALDVVNVNGVATCASRVSGLDLNCVPYNPWRVGGVTPAQLTYLQAPGFRKGGTSLESYGVSLSTDLGNYGWKLPGAKNGVGLAFGLESRTETIDLNTDANVQAGNLSGSGGPTLPLGGEYTVREIFGELRVPVLEGVPMAEELNITGTYRYSDYDKPENTTNTYGLGLEWAPTKAMKFRGSYQRSVRAPNLQDLYLAPGLNLYDNNEDPCSGAVPTLPLSACARTGVTPALYGKIDDSPAGQYNFLQGGTATLKPETANSVTLGLVLQPMRDMSFSIDYFSIKVEDTISSVDPTTTLSQCLASGAPLFCSKIQRDSVGSLWIEDSGRIDALNQNIGTTSTKGWDFGFNYSAQLGGGLGGLNLSLLGTLLTELRTEEVPGLGSYDCVGLYGLSKCGTPSPEWRHKIRANWNTPWDFDVAVTWRYLSKVEIQESTDQPLLKGPFFEHNKTLGAQNYLDLAASWKATKGLTLSMGINNILDNDPPVVVVGTGQGNGNTFPGVYDALGRKVYLSATYKF